MVILLMKRLLSKHTIAPEPTSARTRSHRTRQWHGPRAALLASLLAASPVNASDYRLEVVSDELEYPWSIEFIDANQMLVTERGGDLHLLTRSGELSPPITGVPKTYVRSQGGLFDVLLAEDFATSKQLYLSFAKGTPGANATHVVRATLDGAALKDITAITNVTPTKDTAVHYGGRLAWDPSGALLITTGDGFDYREAAQDKNSLFGKVMRIEANGELPTNNPFVDQVGAHPLVFSYGHRNPQGLTVDRANRRIYLHEHGPRGGDELNLIEAGRNYGWPLTSFGIDYTGALISPFQELPEIAAPLIHWTPSIGASGLAHYRGTAFPEWQGDLFVGALVERSVRRVELDAAGQVTGQEILFRELDARIRDVRVGPDGYLYLLTDDVNGQVIRVVPNSPSS